MCAITRKSGVGPITCWNTLLNTSTGTPQWVRQLRTRLVETGELIVKQSRGRHPNVYIIPYERCPACRGDNPKADRHDFLQAMRPWAPCREQAQTG